MFSLNLIHLREKLMYSFNDTYEYNIYCKKLQVFIGTIIYKCCKFMLQKWWRCQNIFSIKIPIFPLRFGLELTKNSSLFDEFVCKLGLFWHAWVILKRQ
jgi:hypothetical protein